VAHRSPPQQIEHLGTDRADPRAGAFPTAPTNATNRVGRPVLDAALERVGSSGSGPGARRRSFVAQPARSFPPIGKSSMLTPLLAQCRLARTELELETFFESYLRGPPAAPSQRRCPRPRDWARRSTKRDHGRSRQSATGFIVRRESSTDRDRRLVRHPGRRSVDDILERAAEDGVRRDAYVDIRDRRARRPFPGRSRVRAGVAAGGRRRSFGQACGRATSVSLDNLERAIARLPRVAIYDSTALPHIAPPLSGRVSIRKKLYAAPKVLFRAGSPGSSDRRKDLRG